MQIVLETERLTLRRLTPDDLDDLVELDADPAVMRHITGGAATPRGVIEHDYLPHWLGYYDRGQGYGFWVAIERPGGDFLGWFHLRPHDGAPQDEPELGYRLRASAWGKGYATEGSLALVAKAFEELGASRVYATTYQDNLGSRRVMEKVGMRLVRTFRMTPEELLEELGVTDPDLFPGDDVEYAITRDEWEGRARRL